MFREQSVFCSVVQDENVAAHSIGFTSDGRYLVSGFAHSLRCFATDRPGRDFCLFSTIGEREQY